MYLCFSEIKHPTEPIRFTGGARNPSIKNEEKEYISQLDDDIWSMDVSDEAVKKRKQEKKKMMNKMEKIATHQNQKEDLRFEANIEVVQNSEVVQNRVVEKEYASFEVLDDDIVA